MIDRQIGSLGDPENVSDYQPIHGEYGCFRQTKPIRTKGVNIIGNRAFRNTDGQIEAPVSTIQKLEISPEELRSCDPKLKKDFAQPFFQQEMVVPGTEATPFFGGFSAQLPSLTSITFIDFRVPQGRLLIVDTFRLASDGGSSMFLRANVLVDGANLPFAQNIAATIVAQRFPLRLEEGHTIKVIARTVAIPFLPAPPAFLPTIVQLTGWIVPMSDAKIH